MPDIILTIDGVDQTEHLAVTQYSIRHAQKSGSTATFTLQDLAGTYRPTQYQTISLTIQDTLLFSGVVTSYKESLEFGTTSLIRYTVDCEDYAAVLDKRFVWKEYTVTNGGTLDVIVNDIVINYCDGLDITWNGTTVGPVLLDPIKFNGESVRRAFNRLAELTGWSWRLTLPDNELVWYDPTAGIGAATDDLIDGSGLIESISVNANLNLHANTVLVKGGSDSSGIWTDTYTGDGVTFMWNTTYALFSKPIVKIDGVEQLVGTSDEVFASPGVYRFYYIEGGIGLNLAAGATIPAVGEVIEIITPSTVNPYVRVEDTAQITADGYRIESLIEASDIDSSDTLQTLAEQKLTELKKIPIEIEATVRNSLYFPGQTVLVDIDRLGINDTFLIDEVSYKGGFRRQAGEIKPFVVQTLRASNFTDHAHKAGRVVSYMERLINRNGSTQDKGGTTTGGTSGSDTASGIVSKYCHASTESPLPAGAEAITGSINGSNTDFELPKTPDPALSLLVYLNGVKYDLGTHYTLVGKTITTTFAPKTDDILTAYFVYRDAVPVPSGSGAGIPTVARRYDDEGLVGSVAYDSQQSWIQFPADSRWAAPDDLSIFGWFKLRESAGRVMLISHGYPDYGWNNQQYYLDINVTGAGNIRYGHDVANYLSLTTFDNQTLDAEKAYFICVTRNFATKTLNLYLGDKTTAPVLVDTKTYATDPPTITDAQGVRIGKPLVAGIAVGAVTNGDIGPVGLAPGIEYTLPQVILAWQNNPVLTNLELWVSPESPENDPEVNRINISDAGDVNEAPIVTDF